MIDGMRMTALLPTGQKSTHRRTAHDPPNPNDRPLFVLPLPRVGRTRRGTTDPTPSRRRGADAANGADRQRQLTTRDDVKTLFENTWYSAKFSACGRYRYNLRREWDESLPTVLFVMLNPSTADEAKDDPTIRRCMTFARDWGYGRIIVANLFAFRATDPAQLKQVDDPVGPDNFLWLKKATIESHLTIAAWGVHGAFRNRNKDVLPMPDNPHHLGLTKDGHPKHPLYLPGN